MEKGVSISDVPVVREFPDVFSEELLGVPLAKQVEFKIDWVPQAALIAKEPYAQDVGVFILDS